jgi:hypothetical protein
VAADRRSRRSAYAPTRPARTWSSLVAEVLAPIVAEIDALVKESSEDDADVVRRFLEDAAGAADRHAMRLAADADATARDALTVPLPAFWA